MTLALEINDAGLVLARDGAILAEEPGVAMLDGASPETGVAAVLRARLKPLYAETRYWQDLGTEPLARAVPAAANRAEIAFAQLERLVAPHLGDGREIIIAVPPWYSREQLGLLLGVAKESGLEPVGLVDAGLAASSLEPAPETMLHLELGLHRAVVTVLDCAAGLRRTRFEMLPQHGWLALQQAWLDAIAAAFVLKTRFDPLHQAATEQLLCDGLPAWLAAAVSGGTASIELESGPAGYSVAMSGGDFEGAATHSYDEYTRVLQRARPTAGPLKLRLSSRFAAFPGLEARLAGIRDCDIVRLPRGAAALGALAWERSHPPRPGGAHAGAASSGRIAWRRGDQRPVAGLVRARACEADAPGPREPRLSNRFPAPGARRRGAGRAGGPSRSNRGPGYPARTARSRRSTDPRGWRTTAPTGPS